MGKVRFDDRQRPHHSRLVAVHVAVAPRLAITLVGLYAQTASDAGVQAPGRDGRATVLASQAPSSLAPPAKKSFMQSLSSWSMSDLLPSFAAGTSQSSAIAQGEEEVKPRFEATVDATAPQSQGPEQ